MLPRARSYTAVRPPGIIVAPGAQQAPGDRRGATDELFSSAGGFSSAAWPPALPWLFVGFIEDPSRGACLNPTCSCWSSWPSWRPSSEFSMRKFDSHSQRQARLGVFRGSEGRGPGVLPGDCFETTAAGPTRREAAGVRPGPPHSLITERIGRGERI